MRTKKIVRDVFIAKGTCHHSLTGQIGPVVAMEADDDAILAKILVNENEGGVKVK